MLSNLHDDIVLIILYVVYLNSIAVFKIFSMPLNYMIEGQSGKKDIEINQLTLHLIVQCFTFVFDSDYSYVGNIKLKWMGYSSITL